MSYYTGNTKDGKAYVDLDRIHAAVFVGDEAHMYFSDGEKIVFIGDVYDLVARVEQESYGAGAFPSMVQLKQNAVYVSAVSDWSKLEGTILTTSQLPFQVDISTGCSL